MFFASVLKSLPALKAMEYKVSPFCTVYLLPLMLMPFWKSLTLVLRLLTGAGLWRDEHPESKTTINTITYNAY